MFTFRCAGDLRRFREGCGLERPARMLRALMFAAALICLVGPSCSAPASESTRTGEAGGGRSHSDFEKLASEIQDAFVRRDFDAAYRMLLPGEGGNTAEAAYDVAFLLMGGLEMVGITKRGTAPWYRTDLMKQLPMEERVSVGLLWLRRGAYLGSTKALRDLAHAYRWGHFGLPANLKLSDCFREASDDASKIPACREMEQERGYAPP